MVTLVYGHFTPKKGDVILSNYTHGCIYKTSIESGNSRVVIYADSFKLKNSEVAKICKLATRDIVIISANMRLFANIRKGKKVQKDFNEEVSDTNPFDITRTILTTAKRSFIFEYLKNNKVQLYMIVKIMTSNFYKMSKQNRKITAFLDTHLFSVQQDILYAIIAFLMHPEPQLQYLKWNYPKKTT